MELELGWLGSQGTAKFQSGDDDDDDDDDDEDDEDDDDDDDVQSTFRTQISDQGAPPT